MARSRIQHAQLTPDTLAGAIKLRAEAADITLGELARVAGMRPNSLRARLSISRGKRALQPWQCSQIAKALSMDEQELHRLAAKQEGWKV
ncbi:hypothetical protein [Coralloluteibacterium thermophilus]|uniref:XRE family transcriptional regulator n=1 Tax=Coralloluteibacterium thermophilum TaxID=2707049 RepID=A0ABV9NHT5_9GAMM